MAMAECEAPDPLGPYSPDPVAECCPLIVGDEVVSTTNPVPTEEVPVVGVADQNDDVTVDGTVGGVVLIAANPARKAALVQNTGAATIRVTVDGSAPTATHGLQLSAGAVLRLEMPYCPVGVVKAIREGAVSSAASVLEIT